MAIKNYRGERDYTPSFTHPQTGEAITKSMVMLDKPEEQYNNKYRRLVAYLVDIENRFPDLYRMLDQIPQFEYDIEICRKKKSFACQYLSVLEVLVQEYQYEDSPDMEKLNLWRASIPSFG